MTLLLCLVLAAVTANAQITLDTLAPSNNLIWSSCYSQYECAKLSLPLDPDCPSDDLRVHIPLLKIPANVTSDNYSGMMLFNPGGPGNPGSTFLPTVAPILSQVIGPTWDIVTFDPRGVGFAYPSTNCSNTSIIGGAQSPLSKRSAGISVPGQLDFYFEQASGLAHSIGQQCNATIGANSSSIGHYVSTYYVVRDILGIVDAYSKTEVAANLTNPNLVNIYCLSYGTIIGQTLVSEFPQKTGRIVLDGVLDPYDYISLQTRRTIYLDDEVLEQFLRLCQMAGPNTCAFASNTTSTFGRFNGMMRELNPRVAASNGWQNASDISLALNAITYTVSGLVFVPLQTFTTMGRLFAELEPVILHNFSLPAIEAAINRATAASSAPSPPGPAIVPRSEWGTSILCADGDWVYGQNFSMTNITMLRNQSTLQADGEYASHFIQCSGWPIAAKERFAGPFGSPNGTASVQFVGITLDYATPLANAIEAAHRFGGGGVIAIDSVGHTGFSSLSRCGQEAIQRYLATGNPISTFCPVELIPFNVTLSEYGWVNGGKVVSNQSRVYQSSAGDGPLLSGQWYRSS